MGARRYGRLEPRTGKRGEEHAGLREVAAICEGVEMVKGGLMQQWPGY